MSFEGVVERVDLHNYGEDLFRVTNLSTLEELATAIDNFRMLNSRGYSWRDVVELRVDGRGLYYFVVERGLKGDYNLFEDLKGMYKGPEGLDWLSTTTAGSLVSQSSKGVTELQASVSVDEEEEETGLLEDDDSATGISDLCPLSLFVRSTGESVNIGPGPVSIGRSSRLASVSIPGNKNLSREHCEVFSIKQRAFIKDLGSRNGVFVQGKQISPSAEVEIKYGDVVTLADEEIEIR